MAAKRRTSTSKVTKKAAGAEPPPWPLGGNSEASAEVLAHVEAAGARLLSNFRLSTVLALATATLGAACAPNRGASDEELDAWARNVARQALALEAGLTAELERERFGDHIDDAPAEHEAELPQDDA